MIDLISVHVPKTAGTAFRSVLEQVYGKQAVRLEDGSPQTESQRALCRVIHGHFPAEHFHKLHPDAKLIAWVREPISRLRSHYAFWRQFAHKPMSDVHQNFLETKMDVVEMSRIPEVRNVQTRLFSGLSIEDFDFVGIFERFNEDVQSLGAMLGWSDSFQVPYLNRTTWSEYRQHEDLPVETMRQLQELNTADIELYQRVLRHRGQTLQSLTANREAA